MLILMSEEMMIYQKNIIRIYKSTKIILKSIITNVLFLSGEPAFNIKFSWLIEWFKAKITYFLDLFISDQKKILHFSSYILTII